MSVVARLARAPLATTLDARRVTNAAPTTPLTRPRPRIAAPARATPCCCSACLGASAVAAGLAATADASGFVMPKFGDDAAQGYAYKPPTKPAKPAAPAAAPVGGEVS